MVSIEQAKKIVSDNVQPSNNEERLKIVNALGSILFEDIFSPIDMPPFRQSAMDGYAIKLNHNDHYDVIDEVKAGDDKNPIVKEGEAVRIFTGAPVPDTANAVIMQEKVSVETDLIRVSDPISLGDNIRPAGEQVKKGELALSKGTLLTPAAIGYLASLGIDEVTVYKTPSIAIVVTGDDDEHHTPTRHPHRSPDGRADDRHAGARG